MPVELDMMPDDNSLTPTEATNLDAYINKMQDLKKEIYKTAKDNIKDAQDCQKLDYDKKLNRIQVCVLQECIHALCLLQFEINNNYNNIA